MSVGVRDHLAARTDEVVPVLATDDVRGGDTFFVLEGETWKHRLSEQEKDIFMPNAAFDKFVETNRERYS